MTSWKKQSGFAQNLQASTIESQESVRKSLLEHLSFICGEFKVCQVTRVELVNSERNHIPLMRVCILVQTPSSQLFDLTSPFEDFLLLRLNGGESFGMNLHLIFFFFNDQQNLAFEQRCVNFSYPLYM